MYARDDQTAHRLSCPQDKRWATIVMESCVMRKYHAQFGERERETRLSRGRKVRSVPTPLSPLLSNIYLDKLDKCVETHLIPQETRGRVRKKTPASRRIQERLSRARRKEEYRKAKALLQKAQQLPAGDPNDPTSPRLRYVRYADDVLCGFLGPREEAEQIKQELGTFLQNTLKLEVSSEKTLITHAQTQAARFLGSDLQVRYCNDKLARDGYRR